jgi:uncharacterized protein YoaH (UPF0181 family)
MKELNTKIKALVQKVSRLMKEGSSSGEKLAALAALERIAISQGMTMEEIGLLDDRQRRMVPISKHQQDLRAIAFLVLKRYFADCQLAKGADYRDKQGEEWEVYEALFTELDYAVCVDLLQDYIAGYTKERNEFFVAWINIQGLPTKEGQASTAKPLPCDSNLDIEKVREKAKTIEKVKTGKKKLKNKE